MKKIIYLPAILLLMSCWNWKTVQPPPEIPPGKVLGYIPTYSNDPSIIRIYADSAREVKNAGKIYVKDNLIFQNDYGFGIHVIDKTDPSNPRRIGFINIAGNLEMSIKGNHLYANSYADLVVVDISNWQSIKEIQRIHHAFYKGYETNSANPSLYIPPPERKVYYECIDVTKGIHIGWRKDSISMSNCYAD
jgi:LVIVD repeat